MIRLKVPETEELAEDEEGRGPRERRNGEEREELNELQKVRDSRHRFRWVSPFAAQVHPRLRGESTASSKTGMAISLLCMLGSPFSLLHSLSLSLSLFLSKTSEFFSAVAQEEHFFGSKLRVCLEFSANLVVLIFVS